jgi:putative ABC transport system ATP-binding protein
MPVRRTVTAMTAISALDVSKRYGRQSDSVVALDHVSLVVDAGEWVAVMGPSGCGKSSLLHILGGLDTPDSGSVFVAGEAMMGRSETARARLRRRSIGYVFQQYNLIGDLDVVGNVELPLLLAGVPRRAARSRARALLDSVGVGDRWSARPADLSGGQHQRVAIARALIARPAVILADEPTGALDSRAAQMVVAALAEAHSDGQTIVMVTHDRDVAAAADHIVSMRDGRVEASSAHAWRPRLGEVVR